MRKSSGSEEGVNNNLKCVGLQGIHQTIEISIVEISVKVVQLSQDGLLNLSIGSEKRSEELEIICCGSEICKEGAYLPPQKRSFFISSVFVEFFAPKLLLSS
ncbi:hypothetical protein TNCV_2300871 [Trichonephila clavipes]|nr:hypothetical protein TNCV_2300871 [Trichonephila clavipes]